jgi:hypothetical protein
LILASGSAVSEAAETPARRPAQSTEAERPAARPVAKRVNAADASGTQAERRGVVAAPAARPRVQPRDPSMTPEQVMAEALRRAAELDLQRGGVDAGGLGADAPRSGSGPVVKTMTNNGSGVQPGNQRRQPGTWPPDPGFPGMGVGDASCLTNTWLERRREQLGGNRAFVTVQNLWKPLPLPDDAVDFDGDGEPDNPVPSNPTFIYYSFLEEDMIEIEWEGGDDNLNLIGLRTEDTNGDTVIDMFDDPDEEDGIADTWTEPGVVLDIIPPPEPGQQLTPEELAAFTNSALPPGRWGDERPVFAHPDGEAVYYWAQSTWGPVSGDQTIGFQDTFDGSQVPDAELRANMLLAMQVISEVCNVVFIQRSQANVIYPFAPVGYTFWGGDPLVSTGSMQGVPRDRTRIPADDYPWVLITAATDARTGMGGNFATGAGLTRLSFQTDYAFDDINGDGFPDFVDFDADGTPDSIVFSNLGTTTALACDSSGDNTVTPVDRQGGANRWTPLNPLDPDNTTWTLSFAASWPDRYSFDINADRTEDVLLDLNLDGEADTITDIVADGVPVLFVDTDGDNGADFIAPVGREPVPLEVLNIVTPSVAVMVHEWMHHMGFNHEHQRPDRDEYVQIKFENIGPAQVDQFSLSLGNEPGPSQYVQFLDEFDPAGVLQTRNWAWAISGAPASGAWEEADPSAGAVGATEPAVDYAFDADDESLFCLLTGAGNVDLSGSTVATSPTLHIPKGSTITYSYWFNTNGTALDAGDGLLVEFSGDGGATWEEIAEHTTPDNEWLLNEIEIGEDLGSMTAQIRFTATDAGADQLVEAGIDRVVVRNSYDFLSIMHYAAFAFSIGDDPETDEFEAIPGFETIFVLPPNTAQYQNVIGNQPGLSQGDRQALVDVYGEPPRDPGSVGSSDPCRADVSQDGFFNGFDIVIFLEWYNAGDLRADFAQPEGVIDVFDLLQFFVDFQNSFACLPTNPPNPVGSNNLDPIDPL